MVRMAVRFVIQIHSGCGPTHYDLMLERPEALATWQVASSPAELAPGGSLAARRLGDHRKAYLTYEGPVSGGRGQVAILDAGSYEPVASADGRWLVRLAGRKLRGTFELIRTGECDAWTLTRRADASE